MAKRCLGTLIPALSCAAAVVVLIGGCNDPGKKCMGGQCDCVPSTCPDLGVQCGTTDDGCGNALDCGTCSTAGQTCESGTCSCAVQSCVAQGALCGAVPDGCGGTYDCGTC